MRIPEELLLVSRLCESNVTTLHMLQSCSISGPERARIAAELANLSLLDRETVLFLQANQPTRLGVLNWHGSLNSRFNSGYAAPGILSVVSLGVL